MSDLQQGKNKIFAYGSKIW